MAETEGRVTLWGIEVFLSAAEEGSISAAARRLGVSPSAVSQQLAGLEAALGTPLLDRGARPMRMTAAGAMFRRHAQTILNAASEARAELARADLSGLTTLRLGMIEDFDAEVTPHLLSRLAGALKGCRFLLETGASHRLLDALEARALDIAVAADFGTETAGDDGWREVHPLIADPFVAVMPRGTGTAGLPLIHYTARHLMGRQIAAHLSRQGTPAPARFELDSYNAILAMVADGAGWTILTPLALLSAQRFLPKVDVAPLPGPVLERTLSLSARGGTLQDIPARVAGELRDLLGQGAITPALRDWPWLEGRLRLL